MNYDLNPTAQDKIETTWYSIFPADSEELVYRRWEDDIIWDHEAMDRIPAPPVLRLDPNDENIILRIPEDVDPDKLAAGGKEKKEPRRSKIVMEKSGMTRSEDQDDVRWWPLTFWPIRVTLVAVDYNLLQKSMAMQNSFNIMFT